MSYQATRRAENPFQQHIQNLNSHAEEESENDDEDTSHNIKFTIPNKNDEKGEWITSSSHNYSVLKVEEKKYFWILLQVRLFVRSSLL